MTMSINLPNIRSREKWANLRLQRLHKQTIPHLWLKLEIVLMHIVSIHNMLQLQRTGQLKQLWWKNLKSNKKSNESWTYQWSNKQDSNFQWHQSHKKCHCFTYQNQIVSEDALLICFDYHVWFGKISWVKHVESW